MFIEFYSYEECTFRITKESKKYWARFEEISACADNLKDLKESEIPMKYHNHRVFKL